jgi:hypothetical protein
MSTTMILTPQAVFRVTCAGCNSMRSGGAFLSRTEAQALASQEQPACSICGSVCRSMYWVFEERPDPIATVRQVHPYAYCRPPLATGIPWAVMHHPEDHFYGAPIAEGPTEAAAWLAAAEGVCA